jgi:hypothetical protein
MHHTTHPSKNWRIELHRYGAFTFNQSIIDFPLQKRQGKLTNSSIVDKKQRPFSPQNDLSHFKNQLWTVRRLIVNNSAHA